MAGPYIADRRLYLDEDGNVVEEGDPRKRTLLVHEGGTLPYERAQALGLIEEKAQAAPAENKQRAAAPENKAADAPPEQPARFAEPKKRGA